MTTPNKITIFRILMIPVFILLSVYYSASIMAGQADARLRWWAIAVFVVAAASDGIDGYLARKYDQGSRLGAILDPLADKGLVIAALLTLSLSSWSLERRLPLWFPVLVIARDVTNVIGALVVNHVTGYVHIVPHWTGKVATFLTMITIAWVMLEVPVKPAYIAAVAGLFVFISGVLYVRDGLKQVHESDQHNVRPPPQPMNLSNE